MFVINPPAVSRYRERHSVSRKKSDCADAMVLANILRTDMAMARVLSEMGDDRSRFADARSLKSPALGQERDRGAPTRQEPAPGHCRLPVGILGVDRLTRSPGPLPATA
jgi:hypothetical protein